MSVRSRVPALLACALAAGVACSHRGAKESAAARPSPDSLSGTVAITGTTFEQRVVLRSGGGTTGLLLSPADSAALSRLGGVEVMLRGQADAITFRVASFVALRVDGAPVADGVLRREGERLWLETAGGKVALGNPPAALRAMVGARVWIGGPLDAGPNVYGVIAPPR